MNGLKDTVIQNLKVKELLKLEASMRKSQIAKFSREEKARRTSVFW